MYIAAGQGQTTPGDKTLMSTETSCHFGHLLQVKKKKKKKKLWSLILYNFFMILYNVYSPGARADNPLGTKFECQQEHLVTSVICCKFQKNLFEVWFYTFFFFPDIIHVYSCRSGADNHRGQNFDVNRTLLSLCSFASSFKKFSWKSDFIHFFHDFIHVYSPRAGPDNPLGTKF